VAGINPDYSYGRDNWAAFLSIMKKYGIEAQVVSELWPKLGATDFTSHVATLAQARPDLIFSCFWAGDTPIFMKQAHAAGLTRSTKLVLTTGGGVHESLKKDFTPEGALLGYNCFYFENTKASALAKEFTRWHHDKFKEWPNYESDHGYFTVAAFKAAVERAARAGGGKWPTQDAIIQALEGVETESLSGSRRYREDHIMEATFFQGFTTHKNKHDFVTIDPVSRWARNRSRSRRASVSTTGSTAGRSDAPRHPAGRRLPRRRACSWSRRGCSWSSESRRS